MSERYGLYRAKVVQRDDDRQRGRIKVQIPSITGSGKTQWVEACMNVGYDNGGDLAIPKIGDTVWIAFEEGDITKPVYVGNFFSAFKTPLIGYDQDTRVISWDNCKIYMKGNQLLIKVGNSAILMTDSTVEIQEGNSAILMTDSKVETKVGNSAILMTDSTVEIKAGTIKLNE